MKNYNDFKNEINSLDRNSVPIIKPYPFLWKYFLQYLKEEPGHYFTEDNFQDNFFNYIQESIDLQNYNIDEFKDKDFWNESVQSLIDYFLIYYNNDSNEETIESNDWAHIVNGKISLDNGQFNTDDIKYADAGNSFDTITGAAVPIWVRPWYNTNSIDNPIDVYNTLMEYTNSIEKKPEKYSYKSYTSNYDGLIKYLDTHINEGYYESYYKVRGKDLNLQAIVNSLNLDFTRKKNDSPQWLRLLMPRNSRRVEIEDLNRNFWVLSSVLSGICAQLFDSNSPVNRVLKDSVNETVQLWENIIYLWASVAINNQELITNNRVEVVPIYSNNLQPYKKYDNFQIDIDSITKDYVIQQVNPIIQKYKDCNLCILPYLRQDNYYRSYYHSEIYLGIVFYNATTKEINYYKLRTSENNICYFSPSNFSSYLYGIRENEKNYSYLLPANAAGNYSDIEGKRRFYAALRIIPQLDFYVNDSGKLVIKNFSLQAYDPAREAILGEDNRNLICHYDQVDTEWIEGSENNLIVKYEDETNDEIIGFGINTTALAGEALYLGEIPSYSYISNEKIIYEIQDKNNLIGDGVLIKIGNFLPYDTNYMSDLAWRNILGEAVSSNNQKTGYVLNYTLKGDWTNQQEINALYRGLGSTNGPTPAQCHLFTPYWDSNKNSFTYSIDTALPYNEVSLNKLKEIGNRVVSEYIDHNYKTSDEGIIYFITAIGTLPWHNTTPNIDNGVFQGYWKNNLLSHLFRYIPFAREEYLNRESSYITIPTKGYLEYLGEINTIEKAVGADYFKSVSGTTWRLPRLFGETQIADYLSIKCTQGDTSEIKYIDLITHPELVDMTDSQKIAYIEQHPYILLNYDQIRKKLANPTGTWTVYDGQVSNTQNNKVYNTTNPFQYKQVFEAKFNSSNGLSQLNDKLGRKINDFGLLNSKDGKVDIWGYSILTNSNQHYSANSWYSVE